MYSEYLFLTRTRTVAVRHATCKYLNTAVDSQHATREPQHGPRNPNTQHVDLSPGRPVQHATRSNPDRRNTDRSTSDIM